MANRDGRPGVNEMPLNPELPDLFKAALRELRLQMRTNTVGTVVTYNAATRRASVRVDIRQVIKDLVKQPTPIDPAPTTVQQPIILQGIPVFIKGTESAYSTVPIVPGTTGELRVSDRNIQGWLSLAQAVDPVAAWTHALADAIFEPSPLPSTKILPPTRPDAHVIEGPLVALGYAAADFVPRGATLIGAIDAMLAAGVAAGGTAAANFTAAQAAWNAAKGAILSTKVQVE